MLQQEIEIPSWDSTIGQMRDEMDEAENEFVVRREQLVEIRQTRYNDIFQQTEQFSPGFSLFINDVMQVGVGACHSCERGEGPKVRICVTSFIIVSLLNLDILGLS